MRTFFGLIAAILFLCAAVEGLDAYTYTYRNATGYRLRVTVLLYDEVEKTGQIEPDASFTVSSTSLLKSWTADVFQDKEWRQILDMTCDLLPGNQTFSIYVEEKKDSDGAITRAWNVLNK